MIATLLFLHQSALNQVVPFHEPVGMLRCVMRKLSEQAHVKLAVADGMPDIGIYVASKDLTVQEILDAVATATWGRWGASGDSFELAADSQERDHITVQENRDLRKALDSWVGSSKALLRPELTRNEAVRLKGTIERGRQPMNAAEDKQFLEDVRRDPKADLLERLLPKISLAPVYALKPGERVVFSTDATAAQHPLPDTTGRQIERYLREQAAWDDARGFVTPGRLEGEPYAWRRGRLQIAFAREDRDVPSLTIALDALSSRGEMPIHASALCCVDEPKNRLSFTRTNLPATAHLVRQYQLLNRRATDKQLAATYLRQNPAEPLETLSPVCEEWAAEHGGNAVMAVPDRWVANLLIDDHLAQPTIVLNSRYESCTVTQSARTWVARPTGPGLMRDFNVNREQLQGFFSDLQKDPANAAILTRQFVSRGGSIWDSVGAALIEAGVSGTPTNLERFFWTLPDAVRKRLLSGQDISPLSLGPQVRRDLTRLVFSHPGLLRPISGRGPDFLDYTLYYEQDPEQYEDEPTLQFPTWPVAAHLTADVQTHREIWGKGEYGSQIYTLRQLAESAAYAEGRPTRWRDEYAQVPFVIQNATGVRLTLRFDNGLQCTERFPVSLQRLAPEPVTTRNFPPAILAELNALKKPVVDRLKYIWGPDK